MKLNAAIPLRDRHSETETYRQTYRQADRQNINDDGEKLKQKPKKDIAKKNRNSTIFDAKGLELVG